MTCKDCPYFISIHAAREGGDTIAKQINWLIPISIHAAREGGDMHNCALDVASPAISIHAAREGGDNTRRPRRNVADGFQSTPPVKAATRYGAASAGQICNFNPRRP